jgi:hypothetical protein
MVWIKSGIAIQRMVSGLVRIISPLKLKRRTSVIRSARIVIGVR